VFIDVSLSVFNLSKHPLRSTYDKTVISISDAVDPFFFCSEYVPPQLHISGAIWREVWVCNKGPSEPKLLALDAEYRMNAGRKMSDAAEVRGPD
jgi:hypothetical protein